MNRFTPIFYKTVASLTNSIHSNFILSMFLSLQKSLHKPLTSVYYIYLYGIRLSSHISSSRSKRYVMKKFE